MTNCSPPIPDVSVLAVVNLYSPGLRSKVSEPPSSSGPPATKSKSSAVQDVSPLESGSQSSGGGLSITPIQLVANCSHSIVTSISSSMKAVGELRSSSLIPTGHPVLSSVHGTRGISVRLASNVGEYRLINNRMAQIIPIAAGRIDRILIIIALTPSFTHSSI